MSDRILTPRQRRLLDLRAARQRIEDEILTLEQAEKPAEPRAWPAKCGTNGGYYRHRQVTKTPPCEPCKKAHADAERAAVARRRLAAAS